VKSFTVSLFVLAVVTLRAPRAHALGFGIVPEGQTVQVGYRSRDDAFVHAKADLAVLPLPGGRDIWGGPLNATRLEALVTFDGNRARAEELRVGLFRFPHVRLLSFERNERLGMAFGAEVLGLELPVPLEGKSSERTYGIAFVGGALSYKMLHEDARGNAHAHGGSFSFTGRVETLQTIAPRFDLRALFAANYTGFVGYDRLVSSVRYLHALVIESELSLLFDLGGAPYRITTIREMNGEIHDVRRPARGERWRLAVFDIGFELHPLDTMGSFGNVAFFKTGISREF